MKVFFNNMTKYITHPHMYGINNPINKQISYSFNVTDEMVQWIEGIFTKICVSVNSEEELLDIYNQAKNSKLPRALIQDAGLTEFKEPTHTCIAIGPDDPIYVDEITGDLPLI